MSKLTLIVVLCMLAMLTEGYQPQCYWSGTAPACQGSCETGEFVAVTNAYGDGKTCATGVKRLCCKMPPQWIAQLPPVFFLMNQQHRGH